MSEDERARKQIFEDYINGRITAEEFNDRKNAFSQSIPQKKQQGYIFSAFKYVLFHPDQLIMCILLIGVGGVLAYMNVSLFWGVFLPAVVGLLVICIIYRSEKEDRRKENLSVIVACIFLTIILIVAVIPRLRKLYQEKKQSERNVAEWNRQEAEGRWEQAKKEASNSRFTTKGGYYAGATEELVKQAVRYAAQGDTVALNKLLDTGLVVVSRAGVEIDVVRSGFSYSRIRQKGEIMELWIQTEGIDNR